MPKFKVLIPDEDGENLVREDAISHEGTLILTDEQGHHKLLRSVLCKLHQSEDEEALLAKFASGLDRRAVSKSIKNETIIWLDACENRYELRKDLAKGRGICFQTKAEAKEAHRALISRLKNEVNDAKIRLEIAVEDGQIVEVKENG